VSTLESVVLGVVQGLTEFLPISSTGHLRIVPAFLGWDDPGAAFTAVTQLGTMAAVVLFFRSDLLRIGLARLRSLQPLRGVGTAVEPAAAAAVEAPDLPGAEPLHGTTANPGPLAGRPVRERFKALDHDARLGWYILFATIPIGIFGLAFKDQIETGARDLYLIGSALIVVGFVMLAAEKVGKRTRNVEDIDARDGAAIGIAQTLALVPGVSRSGATISAGLFMGLDRTSAARFSFLLSVPAVVLSGLFELVGIITGSEQQDVSAAKLTIATVVAFVTGYAAIAWMLRYLTSHSTIVFVVYRVVLGTLVLVLVATGAIH
jgi:undecaprenyl-diphosphatase